MFITSREKSIIDLIIKTSSKHTPQSLASHLQVSVRTIQRDLKTIESMLQSFELELVRSAHNGLGISGKDEYIYQLMQQLFHIEPMDQTPEKKKLQLLIKLLEDGLFFKTEILAKELYVSVTTLATYLDDLSDWFEKFSIKLTRKRGVGVRLIGKEADKRKALATYFLFYFHEELLESLYGLQEGNKIESRILDYFQPDYLMIIDDIVYDLFEQEEKKLTDNDYLGFVIQVAITLQRVESKYHLESDFEITSSQSTRAFQLISELCKTLNQKLSIVLSKSDEHYLTAVMQGSKARTTEMIYYDSVILSQNIQNIIKNVSNQLNVNLSKDFSLFQGLLAHLEPSIFRLKHQMTLFNPLTKQMKQTYKKLFVVVRDSLEKEFPDILFPDDEVAFIVPHFGSALLMQEKKEEIHAVIVCPTGIGTSKMLASRIQKELVEVNSVEIKSIREIKKSNLNTFDIIISTVRLPFDDIQYILVSPLLNKEDIQMIQSQLLSSAKKEVEKPNDQRKRYKTKASKSPRLEDMLTDMKDIQTGIESLIANFCVYEKYNTGYREAIKEMVEQLEVMKLVKNGPRVIERLVDREKIGGVGIPNTNIGLYHCKDDSIQELIFQICHLDQPSTIRGMDNEQIQMKNLLLMLSPDELSLKKQEMLSLISTNLVENKQTMMIYSSANEVMIREQLERLFATYLQNKWIKE